jgi:hypothetical protein
MVGNPFDRPETALQAKLDSATAEFSVGLEPKESIVNG